MSTIRLFEQDAYLGEFEATVERSICEGGIYRVLLDQTAFFPEGGGQPSDEGTLDGIFVSDVQEIDGEIWHTVEAPLIDCRFLVSFSESAIFTLLFHILCNGFFYSVVFSLYLSYNKMNIC